MVVNVLCSGLIIRRRDGLVVHEPNWSLLSEEIPRSSTRCMYGVLCRSPRWVAAASPGNQYAENTTSPYNGSELKIVRRYRHRHFRSISDCRLLGVTRRQIEMEH